MNSIHGARRHPVITSLAAGALVLGISACGSDDDAAVDVDGGTVEVDVTELENDVGSVVDDAVDEVESNTADLAQTLRDNGLDSLASVVEQVDVDELVGDGEFTFLAPNDEAFTSLSADDMADLLSEPGQILDTLQNHLLDGTISAAELAEMDSVQTRAGESLPVTVDADTVMVGDVVVVTTDVEVGGGVIHVVDGFLLPS